MINENIILAQKRFRNSVANIEKVLTNIHTLYILLFLRLIKDLSRTES